MMPAPAESRLEKDIMRSDMHKVIVERPRVLRGGFSNKKTAIRLSDGECAAALHEPEDYDSGPKRAPSARHGKCLNENLAPLRRYLQKQVGRPRDKVYSEISNTIDTRSAIGLHVIQHIEWDVATKTFLRDGVIYESDRYSISPVKGLYVHPVTGILRCTKNWRRRKRWHYSSANDEPNYVRLGDLEAYRKIDGYWFRVDYRRLTPEESAANPGTRFIMTRKQQCDRKMIQRIERGDFGTPTAR